MLEKNQDTFIINEAIIYSAMIQSRSKNYFFPAHAHDTMELYLIKDGSCTMKIKNQEITVKKGEIIMILPYVTHTLATPSEHCIFAHMHIKVNSLHKILYQEESHFFSMHFLIQKETSYYSCKENRILDYLFAMIIKEKKKNDFHSKVYCNLHALELITLIHELGTPTHNQIQKLSSNKLNLVTFCYRYIHENYANKILIEDIAKELHISARYLSAIFLEASNQTIVQYLNVYRINKAIEYMSNPNHSLTDIALAVGLNNSQHFSKLFKMIIGESPSTYRKMLNRNDFLQNN